MRQRAINRPVLHGLSFAITDDLDAHADRRDCVDASGLRPEFNEAITSRRLFERLPDWVAEQPIPLRRPARHFEPLFEAVSAPAFVALRSILGVTIESAEQFTVRSLGGETGAYHRVVTQPLPLNVDWEETRPVLPGVDTSDSYATRKALRRQPRDSVVLALSDEFSESSELLQLTHLSMDPLVTDCFIDRWSDIGLDYAGMASSDGPYLLPVVNYSYRWVPRLHGR